MLDAFLEGLPSWWFGEGARGSSEGADSNTRSEADENTCLMEATENNREEVVDLLLAKKKWGNTALHFACRGNVAILGKLLAVPGLLVNKKNNWGTTLIMVVAMNGRTHTVRLMVTAIEIALDAVVDDGKILEDLVHK